MKFYNIEMGSSLDLIRQNFLINGNFDFWQRGTSFNPVSISSTHFYTADRWKYVEENSTSGHIVIDRNSDSPSLVGKYDLRCRTSVAIQSINSNEVYYIGQYIEGYSTLPLVNKVCTLSFWVKSNLTGTYTVAFQDSVRGRSYVAPYTIISSNVWEKKVIQITITDTATWTFDSGAGLRIMFVLACGSSLVAPPNTWVGNPYYGVTGGQVNFLNSLSNSIKFAGVKFELGIGDTSGMGRSIATELTMCQRYYEKSYNVDIRPGTISTAGAIVSKIINELISVEGNFGFAVPKRVVPLVTIYSPDTLVGDTYLAMYCRNRSNSTEQPLTLYPADSGYVGVRGFSKFNVNSQTNYSIITFHWVADAEIDPYVIPMPPP